MFILIIFLQYYEIKFCILEYNMTLGKSLSFVSQLKKICKTCGCISKSLKFLLHLKICVSILHIFKPPHLTYLLQ